MSIETEGQEPVTLLRSQFQCPKCGELIASIHRHDFQTCSCGETSIDGGLDYLRLAGNWILTTDPDRMKDLSKPLTIVGEHNKASKVLALNVYKALWAASDRGGRSATTTEVFNALRARWNEPVTDRSMKVYLDLFVESEAVKKERGVYGWVWTPLVPLVERSDAP